MILSIHFPFEGDSMAAPSSAYKKAPSRGVAEVPLQVTVPPRIKHSLDLKAAELGTTKRALVLEALRNIGIDVAEHDIAGRRGAKR